MPGGKPRRELISLLNVEKDWETYILNEMSLGASLQEIKAHFSISNDLHTRWMKDEEVYKETIKEGVSKSEAWWYKMGRINLKDKEFSPVLWYMNMKNRFGWRDRQDITTDDQKMETTVIYRPAKMQYSEDDFLRENGTDISPNA